MTTGIFFIVYSLPLLLFDGTKDLISFGHIKKKARSFGGDGMMIQESFLLISMPKY